MKPNRETPLEDIVRAIWGKKNPPVDYMTEFHRRVYEALTSPYESDLFERCARIASEINAELGLDERGRPLR